MATHHDASPTLLHLACCLHQEHVRVDASRTSPQTFHIAVPETNLVKVREVVTNFAHCFMVPRDIALSLVLWVPGTDDTQQLMFCKRHGDTCCCSTTCLPQFFRLLSFLLTNVAWSGFNREKLMQS